MLQTLRSKTSSTRSLPAVAVFLIVYVGVLFVVFAPKDFLTVESGSVIREAD